MLQTEGFTSEFKVLARINIVKCALNTIALNAYLWPSCQTDISDNR
jgi:hypothetical protein